MSVLVFLLLASVPFIFLLSVTLWLMFLLHSYLTTLMTCCYALQTIIPRFDTHGYDVELLGSRLLRVAAK